MFAISQAVAADANVRSAFTLIFAGNSGSQREAAIVIGGVKQRVGISDDPQEDFGQQEAEGQAEQQQDEFFSQGSFARRLHGK